MMLTLCFVLYNEEKHIWILEENLKLLKNSSGKVIFKVIDNASIDRTHQCLMDLQKHHSFELLRRGKNHLGEARAQAIDESQTPWVGFIDADCRLSETWIQNVFSILNETKQSVAAVGGPWLIEGEKKGLYEGLFKTFLGNFGMPQLKRPRSTSNVPESSSHTPSNLNGEIIAVDQWSFSSTFPNSSHFNPHPVAHLPTANVVYRRHSVLAVGNFSAQRAFVGEDLQMSYRLTQTGFELLMFEELRVKHFFPSTLSAWFRKIFLYGEARWSVGLEQAAFFSYIYLLPSIFNLFFILNFVFWREFLMIPAGLYVLVCFATVVQTTRWAQSLEITLWMISTHFAYALGMVYGAVRLSFVKLKLFHKRHRPTVQEGTANSLVAELKI